MKLRNIVRLLLAVVLVLQGGIVFASTSSSEIASIDIKSSPSKVCNPKKPVTCRADELTESAKVVSPDASVAPELNAVDTNERICIGSRAWMCRANMIDAAKQQASTQEQNERICIGSRAWMCRANTIA